MDESFLPQWTMYLTTALAIGLLIGLEQETIPHAGGKRFGGIRTFPLIALGGFASAYWWPDQPVFLIGLGVLGMLLVASFVRSSMLTDTVGITTEVAALLTWLLGGMVAMGRLQAAVTIAVIATLLLAAKQHLHGFVRQYFTDKEILAIAEFALLALVIYPLLPDKGYTELDINPRQIWFMVVLVSGISFIGYFGVRLLGAQRGLFLTAFFGGLVSSTAVTLTLARFSRNHREIASTLGGGIILASTIMFLRQLIEVAIVHPALVKPVALLVSPAFFLGLWFFLRSGKENPAVEVPVSNPLELTTALQFGLLYGFILVLVQLAMRYFGEVGVYGVALLSGVTDVDAITLSTARLSLDGDLPAQVAVVSIVLAGLSNTLVKLALAWVVGTWILGLRLLMAMGSMVMLSLLAVGFYVFEVFPFN
ncbi:MAG: MgtC/SapB family protein [Gammaproteobacteria bacterium]|nr:MAG: MgtC/SapB family protein [Gammaproteobacteria bacterium]